VSLMFPQVEQFSNSLVLLMCVVMSIYLWQGALCIVDRCVRILIN
jgi:hypothetical protein